jgi:hypothetical protein
VGHGVYTCQNSHLHVELVDEFHAVQPHVVPVSTRRQQAHLPNEAARKLRRVVSVAALECEKSGSSKFAGMARTPARLRHWPRLSQPSEPSRSASNERCHTPDTTLHLRRADPLQAMMRIETYRLPVIKMVAARRLPNQMPLTQRQTINTQFRLRVLNSGGTCGGDSASPSRVKNRRLMPRSVKSPWPLKFHTSSWLTSTVRPQSMSMQ